MSCNHPMASFCCHQRWPVQILAVLLAQHSAPWFPTSVQQVLHALIITQQGGLLLLPTLSQLSWKAYLRDILDIIPTGIILEDFLIKLWWPTKEAWRHHPNFLMACDTEKVNYGTLTSCLAFPMSYSSSSLLKLRTAVEGNINNTWSTLMQAANLCDSRSGWREFLNSHLIQWERDTQPVLCPAWAELSFSHTSVFCSRSGEVLAV